MNRSFNTSDFDYALPVELIAQSPLAVRSASRLLQVDAKGDSIKHNKFNEIVDFFCEKDLLVFNDTKVIPARLFGEKETGGKVECLVERVLSDHLVLAHLRSSKSPKAGGRLRLADAIDVTVVAREGELFKLKFESEHTVLKLLNKYGQVPLPPYIERAPDSSDEHRYQTVFAKKEGAVAAPTAGLHFDESMMGLLKKKGIAIEYVTLHVGAGTFQPVRTDSLSDHKMHGEYIEVSEKVCEAVKRCRERGGRVIAIGTTVVRCLETAAKTGEMIPFKGETNLFIYPGYQFHCVDVMLTNFHLPKSTLLMLVCAFGGYELIMRAYQEAVLQKYRFFSYGDAMLVE